ncbi:hypothetical protein D9613_012632 [Agrocybe pediades]|uniref:Uncharacterized protein n=1 Tax=Agrocybe pediades TaxID=84607 RepID=A0A8H4QWE7_9AGAR|nr:hypothetical protein D9613_012632 [Agrocybe pediades]
MDAPDDFPFSVAQQKAVTNSDLNSTLLYQFLFGIYTGVFPVAMYIYVHSKNRTRTKDVIIIGSITALYFLTAVNTAMNWLYTNILFITNGGTRVDLFMESALQGVPLGQEIIGDLTIFAAYVFADGLLVWRCFHSCGRSFYRSSLPIALLVVETVLAITATAYTCLLTAKPNFETDQTDLISSRLNAATYVVVAATSVVSTGVICRQIWGRASPRSRSWKHYRTIINILLESSAMYTVAVLYSAISDFISTGDLQSSYTIILLSNFLDGITQIVSGLAPTLMIVRLCVSSGKEDAEDSSAHLPPDLIGLASHATHADMKNVGGDLEMQRSELIGVGEQESEEIQVVPSNQYHGGQPEHELQDRLKAIV